MNRYLELLLETSKTSRMMSEVIEAYLLENRISCNTCQIMTLHLLMELGGNGCPYELQPNIKFFRKNNSYSYQILAKNGYITQKKGEEIGLDGRAIFFEVTPKGKNIHKDICEHLEKKLNEMKAELEWGEENLLDYQADLVAIQHFLKDK